MSKKYIISAVEGARGHFLSEFLFNPNAVSAVEMNHRPWPHLSEYQFDDKESVDLNLNYVTHSGRLSDLKTIFPDHVVIQLQAKDYWPTAFLQWTKVGPWYMQEVKKLESFTDQVFQYMTEIKLSYQRWQIHTVEQHLADHIVDFDLLNNSDYMSTVYQDINGHQPDVKLLDFMQGYFDLQPKFNSTQMDLRDPVSTALILSRYEILNQPKYFPFAIAELENGLDPLDYISQEQLGITDIHYRFSQ